ncbi:hypothetical protein [Mesorhizobium opportunistum]|uniref:hypothetical protein n=1 Tax=Mesorhizobium opportunistum TaxID=593909 RepID=UPI003307AA68
MRLKFIHPMEPELVDTPPHGDDWLHEIKFDGYRTQVIKDEDGIRLITKNGYDWTGRYIQLAGEAAAARETVYVTCGHPLCCRSTRLDIQVPIDRLGPDHGSMHQDLAGLFICSACKAAGRDRRPVFFTCVPDYESHTRSSTATGSRRSNDKMATGRAGCQDLARSYASTECDIGAT